MKNSAIAILAILLLAQCSQKDQYDIVIYGGTSAGVVAAVQAADLVDALKGSGAPTLHVVISDGERLFFSLGLNGRQPKLFGGIDFRRLTAAGKRKRVSQSDIKTLDSSMGVECGHYVRIDVNVTRMAKDLPLNR